MKRMASRHCLENRARHHGVFGSLGFWWLGILLVRLNLPKFAAIRTVFKALRRVFVIVTYRGQAQCPVLNLEEGSDNFADATFMPWRTIFDGGV